MIHSLRIYTFGLLLTIIALVSYNSHAGPLEMMADIRAPLETEFGQYVPQIVDVKPCVSPFTVADDFNNVSNFDRFEFSDAEKALLRENGFVAIPSEYKEMYEVYNEAQQEGVPIFVTVDALLHAFHEQFDAILRVLEEKRFALDISDLTLAMLDASIAQSQQATDPRVLDAAQRNSAFFAVAARSLQLEIEIPDWAADWLNAELQKIEVHNEFTSSPLFEYDEDYTQYVPRGHYTLSDTLSNYFRAMMWYGRMTFHIKANAYAGVTQEMAERETIQALLMTQLMNTLTVNESGALDVWDRIYQPTAFFVGQCDDLTFSDYAKAAREIYGDNFAESPVDLFSNAERLNAFMNYSFREASKIAPEFWGTGLRFMGQRFIPDSYVFSELYEGSMALPMGMEFLAILGSQRAKEILIEKQRYANKHDEFHAEFASMDAAVWAQNAYWNWLYCLMPVIAEKGEGFPAYMQSPAWRDKDLACALGSWAELRHDTILYAKQSYGRGASNSHQSLITEFVEPNPWAFARLFALSEYVKTCFKAMRITDNEWTYRLDRLSEVSNQLMVISEKQLTQQVLTAKEKEFVRTIGQPLTYLCVNPNITGSLSSNTDFFIQPAQSVSDDMAVIADVHSNGDDCLEVGVGRPLTLYVIVDSGEALSIATGSAFAYYEFPQPMSDRLTDEAWQSTLDDNQQPDRPEWTASYISGNSVNPQRSVTVNEKAAATCGFNIQLSTDVLVAGMELHIRISYDEIDISRNISMNENRGANYFVPENHVCYAQIDIGGVIVEKEFVPDESTENPYDYYASFETEDWPEGSYRFVFYCPTDIGVYREKTLYVNKANTSINVNVQDWNLHQ